MRRLFPALVSLALAAAVSIAPALAAESSTCSVGPNLPSLPIPPCPSIGWNTCNSIAQYINNYNQWLQLKNEAQSLVCQNQMYWRNPLQYASHIQETLSQLAQIEQQAGALSAQDKNLDSMLQTMWPDYNPGYSPQQMDDKLDRITYDSTMGVLKGAGYLSAVDPRDQSAVQAIKAAAARAKNPTIAQQMNVQLSAIIYDQLVKQTQFTALKMSQAAAYDMAQAARERSNRITSERNGEVQARMMYPVPPKLSSQQLQQLQNSWNQ